jgi:hypothetical protein
MDQAVRQPRSTVNVHRQTSAVGPRVALLIGSGLLAAAPLAAVEPAAHWLDDPELFKLLRGMAGIKALLAAIALAAAWWRLGRSPAPAGLAVRYIGGVWALALATGLIWQLTVIPAASVLFHAATITLLVTAWADAAPDSARPTRSNEHRT